MLSEFFSAKRVPEIYLPRYTQIINEAAKYRLEHNIKPVEESDEKIALFVIDAKLAFAHQGQACLCLVQLETLLGFVDLSI